MISMEPVLKRGYTAWDQEVLPADEYAARVALIREALQARDLMALVIVNYSLLGALFDYADMAYLTGLQSGGLALLTRHGAPAFVSFGGGRELYFLRTQTWMDVVAGGRNAFDVLREQLRSRDVHGGKIGTVGTGGMPKSVLDRLTAALDGYELVAFDRAFGTLRAAKRPREVLAVRIAKGIVDDAVAAAFVLFEAGGDNTAAMIEAERVARIKKARDVRVLASMGGADLRPFEGRLDGRHEPLHLWVAAQYQGYWAEAAGTYPAPEGGFAREAVRAMQAAARANARVADVAAAALAALPADARDAALAYGFGETIGLAANEGIAIRPDSVDVLLDGALLALRAFVQQPAASLDGILVQVAADGAHLLGPLRVD